MSNRKNRLGQQQTVALFCHMLGVFYLLPTGIVMICVYPWWKHLPIALKTTGSSTYLASYFLHHSNSPTDINWHEISIYIYIQNTYIYSFTTLYPIYICFYIHRLTITWSIGGSLHKNSGQTGDLRLRKGLRTGRLCWFYPDHGFSSYWVV